MDNSVVRTQNATVDAHTLREFADHVTNGVDGEWPTEDEIVTTLGHAAAALDAKDAEIHALRDDAVPRATGAEAELITAAKDLSRGDNLILESLCNALENSVREREERQREIERLRGVIERERTQTSRWLERITAEIARWYHISEGRGPYEWDDDRYRAEFKTAMEAIRSACDKAAKDCNTRSFEDCPTTHELVTKARAGLWNDEQSVASDARCVANRFLDLYERYDQLDGPQPSRRAVEQTLATLLIPVRALIKNASMFEQEVTIIAYICNRGHRHDTEEQVNYCNTLEAAKDHGSVEPSHVDNGEARVRLAIAERWVAGESIPSLQSDYSMSFPAVLRSIKWVYEEHQREIERLSAIERRGAELASHNGGEYPVTVDAARYILDGRKPAPGVMKS